MNNQSLDTLTPLFLEKGTCKNIEDFYTQVNIIFHDIEAKYYDKIHLEMWENIPMQMDRLISNDILSKNINENLKVLDIGCGTGLAVDTLSKGKIGEFIESVTLLDISNEMLKKAAIRSRKWKFSSSFIHGDIDNINSKFDLIICSSFLHHVPELDVFLKKIDQRLNNRGLFIHIHDPNAYSINSDVFVSRKLEYNKKALKRSLIKKIFYKIKTILTKDINYIEEVNNILMQEKIIKKPLSSTEIWSITDIHVDDLPYSIGKGISLDHISEICKNWKLLNSIYYCYFGVLYKYLNNEYRKKEINLYKNNDHFGRNLAGCWIKRS